MLELDSLKHTINTAIRKNGSGEITGPVLNSVLNDMIDEGISVMAEEIENILDTMPDSTCYFEKGDRDNSIKTPYGNTASGQYSIAMGSDNKSEGQISFSCGENNTAQGNDSFACGSYNISKGHVSFSCGTNNLADGNYSHVEGHKNTARGSASHAEGYMTSASEYAHSEGHTTEAKGNHSHAEGHLSIAEGEDSHAEGYGTHAKNRGEHASGTFNISIKKDDSNTVADATQFTIGIGTSDTDRKNAIEIKQNGDIYIIGIGDYDGTNYAQAKSIQDIIPLLNVTSILP